jgi:hypothetical protein
MRESRARARRRLLRRLFPGPLSRTGRASCRDRNRARAPRGVLVPTGDVSRSPSTIPDGRISRVRFCPRLCTPFLRAGLPPARETVVLAHPAPPRGGVCLAPSPRCRPRLTQLCVWCVPNCRGHRVPRAPLPGAGVTRTRGGLKAAWRGVTPPRRSYGLMRQATTLPAPRLAPVRRVFAGCRQCLLGDGPSPHYLAREHRCATPALDRTKPDRQRSSVTWRETTTAGPP